MALTRATLTIVYILPSSVWPYRFSARRSLRYPQSKLTFGMSERLSAQLRLILAPPLAVESLTFGNVVTVPEASLQSPGRCHRA